MVEILEFDQRLHGFISDEPNEKRSYSWSRYNIETEADSGCRLVYNTLYRTLCACSQELNDSSDRMVLARYGFLVPQDANEYENYMGIRQIMRELSSTGSVGRFNILTTTGCNARCFYCFENGLQTLTMADHVADKVAEYIAKTASAHVHLRWFGGEPLVNHKAIDRICKNLEMAGVVFESSMSTNGTLFSVAMMGDAVKKWNLKQVRMSLDGLRDEHNRRKAIAGGVDAFQLVIDNAIRLSDAGVRVLLRITMDPQNSEECFKVADYLRVHFCGRQNVSAYTAMIFSETTPEAAAFDLRRVQRLVKDKERLDAKLISYGLFAYEKLTPVGFQTNFCAANDPSAVVIYPDGRLSCCETIDSDSEFWGDVSGCANQRKRLEWTGILDEPARECRDCQYLPCCTSFFKKKCPHRYYDCKARCDYYHKLYMKCKYEKRSSALDVGTSKGVI